MKLLIAVLLIVLSCEVRPQGQEHLPLDKVFSPSRSAHENEISDNPLHCPPCEQIHCPNRRHSRMNCKGGLTLDLCNCCSVCAKTEGQTCGGDWNYLGKCDRGLRCDPQLPQVVHYNRDGVQKMYTINKGICKVDPDMMIADETQGTFCHPKCTPHFCKKHPSAICSAAENAEKEQECQSKCQHTSCRACRMVEEPTCEKCMHDDFRCLRMFGKCVKRHLCQKRQFPCKQTNDVENEKGRFLCKIPECLKL